MKLSTPLRYPGGKSRLYGYIADCIKISGARTYAEPFCGGAGVALKALSEGLVSHIIINDYDPAIFSIWQSIVNENQRFIDWLKTTCVTLEEWQYYRNYYMQGAKEPSFELGCAAFFLNRTNFSGVVSGGAIGGMSQSGKYKVDCRFNKETLISKIQAIGKRSSNISVLNMDGKDLLDQSGTQDGIFWYIDPPYVSKGKYLYRNDLNEQYHTELANLLDELRNMDWLLSYDEHPLIENLYQNFSITKNQIRHNIKHKTLCNEIFVHSESLSKLYRNQ